ncbi:MAG: histidine--tRNA ligase [Thermoplasmatota archaeon]
MADFTRPRGTRDFGPEEMRARREVEKRMREAIEAYGYEEISTPTFEHSDLFIARSGPQILDQIYDFKDKGGRDLVLRPELTAPVMRYYFSELRNSPKPLRIYYFGNCFRYERPQKGRYREFWQLGLEYIGTRSTLALSEVINASISALEAAGLEGFDVRVGHVALLSSILSEWSVDSSNRELMIAIDKKDRPRIVSILGGGEDAEKVAELVSSSCNIHEASRILQRMRDEVTGIDIGALEELSAVMDRIIPCRGNVKMDPSITRGLDYYDGIVFEIDAPTLGAEKQICGGGAYSLSDVFDGVVEGIGFGLGFDRILVALGKEVKETDGMVSAYLIPMGGKAGKEAPALASAIRSLGMKCFLETSDRPFKKALAAALNSGSRFLIVLGDNEIQKGTVTIKDLSTKKQVEVPRSDVGRALGVRS